MSENLHTLCAWAARFRAYCELEDGPDSMGLTVGDVTLHVTAQKARVITPGGAGELDIDAMRFAAVADATPLSSKQHWNDVREENE